MKSAQEAFRQASLAPAKTSALELTLNQAIKEGETSVQVGFSQVSQAEVYKLKSLGYELSSNVDKQQYTISWDN